MSQRTELETEVLRAQTKAYIEDAPFTTRLTPNPETTSAAGGKVRTAGTPRKPQTFRMVPLDRRNSATKNVQTGRPADGVEREANFEIMGEWDFEIARGDTFLDDDGTKYEVVEVQPSFTAPYMRRAFVRGIPDS